MIKKMKFILEYLKVYGILIAIFVISLLLVSLFPSKWIKGNVKKSAEELSVNGCISILDVKYKYIYLFDYTDAIMINNAYSIDSKEPVKSFVLARRNYIPGETKVINTDTQFDLKPVAKYINSDQVVELNDTINNNIDESFEYSRYWHGYLVFLRPLLLLFSYKTIGILSLVSFVILASVLLYLICKKINITTAIIFLIGMISVDTFHTTFSLNSIVCNFISVIFSIYILKSFDKIKNISILFFIIGAITAFLDFLTLPIITLGIPITIYFLILQKQQEDSLKNIICRYIKICFAWAAGYALTWATKWVITDLLYQRNIIKVAFEQIIFRLGDGAIGHKFRIRDVILYNKLYFGAKVIKAIIAINVVWILFRKWNKNLKIKTLVPYLITGLLPFLWFATIKNHSIYHSLFTYRILVLSVIGLQLIICEMFNKSRSLKRTYKKLIINSKEEKSEDDE